MMARIMRLLLLFSALALSFSLAAQYPANGIKSRLGYQTTGDGLVYRGSGAPAYSPGTMFNAWMYLDTTNFVLYGYIGFQWQRLPLVNNGLTADGAYHQLGGTLVENTTIETGSYLMNIGKNSGTDYAKINIYGSGLGAGLFNNYGTGGLEAEVNASGGIAEMLVENISEGGNSSIQVGKHGFYQFYLHPSIGVSYWRMDSTKFRLRGLLSYASHAAADLDNTEYQLYKIDNSRAIYIKNSTVTSQDILGTGTTDRLARWTGTNTLAAGNLSDNGTRLQALLPWQFQSWTTAGRPTGTTGYTGYNTTGNGPEWYNGTRWAYALESTFARGTATRVPFFDANGQVTESSLLSFISATGQFKASRYTFNTATGFELIPFGSTELAILAPTNGIVTFYGDGADFIPFFTNQDLGSTNRVWSTIYGNNLIFSAAGTASSPSIRYRIAGNNIGAGMYFVGNLANHDLGFSTNSTARLYLTYSGLVGVGTTTPLQELDVNGDAYIRDSLRLTSTPAHTSITGLLTRDANGWHGLATVGSGLSYAAGVLSATGTADGNGIISALPLGNVKINSTNSLTFKNGITRWTASGEQTGVVIAPSFVGVYKTTTGNAGGYIGLVDTTGRDNSFYFTQDDRGLIQNTGIGRQIVLLADNTSLPGQYRWAFGARVDTSTSGLTTLRVMLGDRYASTTVPVMVSVNAGIQASENIANAGVTVAVNGSNGKKAFTVNDGITLRMSGKVYFAIDSTLQFDPSTDLLRLSQYGTLAKTAAATGKTGTNINATYATDGTLLEIERKRDTTVYIDDADYDWSAVITTAQIASRYNRVIFWMTTTGAAGSDSELTLHTPDANLMQVEYLIHSVDEPAGFDNKIVFGTNNAVDSTNGLVTNYYPAAGDGIHIRAGLRSGVYKYRYSN